MEKKIYIWAGFRPVGNLGPIRSLFFTAAGEKPHCCYKFPIQFLFFNSVTFHHQRECGLTILLIQKHPEISRNFSFHALPRNFH